jgi:hypothetical protein|tara:strand:- start:364 stop:468 length:105 start_codon:yes stop_codon:yes gene_type:complete
MSLKNEFNSIPKGELREKYKTIKESKITKRRYKD